MKSAAGTPESIQYYIAGHMSDNECLEFENQLLGDPLLVRDVEESLRLREGLEVLQARNEMAAITRRPRHAFLMATAAAVLLAGAVYVAMHHFEPSTGALAASISSLGERAGSPLRVVDSHAFATLRGAADAPTLTLPAAGALEFRALTGNVGTNPLFRATLETTSGRDKPFIVGAVEGLIPDADGFVVLYADAAHLQPGDYILIVARSDDDPTAQRFTFTLQGTPPR